MKDSYQTRPVPTTPSTRGYVDVGDPLALRRVFDEISEKDVSSWMFLRRMSQRIVVCLTAMINGDVQNRDFVELLKLFVWMLRSGT
ncbi:hypothetical protein TIFTF001_021420 [Ficus carica]|uniref:Uncharacterized protein n=1 Tax=Ficus carica TaxID=3494 RepID=A0AA88DBV2_FICCA|nr:hypothetical protein TIFTF001_021420 [Ficus carica]